MRLLSHSSCVLAQSTLVEQLAKHYRIIRRPSLA
ncbi:hypothetical protein XBKQ1_260008 [Xenorhabdus bovienii str. kraussei Quebec]|uniref:Uncharacterized protein n=1 Tax=Xenorhabdus bovienii str. kraussei Quebec TaxID=1398203 RepID=A0A077PI41_XENBV|nr:hypothetical protein XBKQ1_260008 [Xenorhabdus bovienii str. kraussei Quebec]